MDFFSISVLHAASVFALLGLIWTIQRVHYPMLEFVEEVRWAEAHRFHCARMLWVVFPAMVTELLSAGALVWFQPSVLTISLLVCAIGNWILTAVIFVPLHNRLAQARDMYALRRLVKWNWTRTVLWSITAGLAFVNCWTLKNTH